MGQKYLFLILLTLNTINAGISMSLGVLPDGDPAPGRSPGPPFETDDDYSSGNDSSAGYRDDKQAEVNRSEVISDNSLDTVMNDDIVDKCDLLFVEDVIDITLEDSDVGMEIVHSVFDTEELVKGVVYKVELTARDPGSLRSFAISTEIIGEKRGIFSTVNSGTIACRHDLHTSIANPNITTKNNETVASDGKFEKVTHSNSIDSDVSSDLIVSDNELVVRKKRDISKNRRLIIGSSLAGTWPSDTRVIFKWSLMDVKLNEIGRLNVTFRLRYRRSTGAAIYQVRLEKLLRLDCNVSVRTANTGRISSTQLSQGTCVINLPQPPKHYGLLLQLNKFNVQCRVNDFIKFAPSEPQLCGKLEELPLYLRQHYYNETDVPAVHIHGKPHFVLSFNIVDSCYNVIFTNRNGSFHVGPSDSMECSFTMHLPYGYRVLLRLQMTTYPNRNSSNEIQPGNSTCKTMLITLRDGDRTWNHCSDQNNPLKNVQIVSLQNNITISVKISNSTAGVKSALRAWWNHESVEPLVGQCSYGWLWSDGVCITAFKDAKKQWRQAEAECVRNGGHLIALRNQKQQELVDKMLLHSPNNGADEVYWIGATDFVREGDFRWSNGKPFLFTHWYPGGHTKAKSQPNDDGLSRQDCVEIRRHFPTKRLGDTYMWNDRSCHEHNYYICERPLSDEPTQLTPQCNETIHLSPNEPRYTLTSPGFPRQYPDDVTCVIDISAPFGFDILIEFEELVLENEVHCSYDFIEIIDYKENNDSVHEAWNERIHPSGIMFHDLLEHSHYENEAIEEDDQTVLHSDELSSGYSRNFSSGLFLKRLCGDWSDKLKLLRYTSSGPRARVRFQSDHSHHYGGFKAKISTSSVASCIDPRFKLFKDHCYLFVGYPKVSWHTAHQVCEGLGSHLTSVHCAEEQGFITSLVRNSPDYNAGDVYWIGANALSVNESRRFIIWSDGTEFTYESWPNDEVKSMDSLGEDACLGLQWNAYPNRIQQSGIYWHTEKCSKLGGYICKRQLNPPNSDGHLNRTVLETEGNLTSNNFPLGYAHNSDYWIEMKAPEMTRILIKFNTIDLEFQKDCLYDFVELSDTPEAPNLRRCGTVSIPTFWVSKTNSALLHFHSDYSISGRGFSLTWKAVDVSGCPEQTLTAKEGVINSPNYPEWLLPNLDCSWNIVAPLGKRLFLNITYLDLGVPSLIDNQNITLPELKIFLQPNHEEIKPFHGETLLSDGIYLSDGEMLKVNLQTGDHPNGKGFAAIYKTVTSLDALQPIEVSPNGGRLRHLNYPKAPQKKLKLTTWLKAPPYTTMGLAFAKLVPAYHDSVEEPCGPKNGWIEVTDKYADVNGTQWHLCESDTSQSFEINTFLHTVIITQHGNAKGVNLDATVKVKDDPDYVSKLLELPEDVGPEYCSPDPCLNDGVCVVGQNRNFCRCSRFYTGPFCALTVCERSRCANGNCTLSMDSPGGWTCSCIPGWGGKRCATKVRACDAKPCQGRGACKNILGGFLCKCNPTWKGARCEIRDMQVRYKALSERMLQEPFWLGLITVFVVMGVIGLVWCAKRHFPEKLEKLLAEEADRCTRPTGGSNSRCCNSTAASTPCTTAQLHVGVETTPGNLITRLIRKPSIRACSLDDLLRPPRRTPSPRKKRNNSTPSKKNAVEKKQILQQLISPGDGNESKSPSKDKRTLAAAESAPAVCASTESSKSSDPRLEKKVTFARLLSKVSAEISSGSEENGRGQRAASTPPSPGGDVRSTSSSLDFGETALRKQVRSPKISSADSLLAMFRSFSAAGASRASSTVVSASTTPTASSPQDDTGWDDDSFASSNCPYSTGYESPQGGPIEVKVVESGRGSSSSGDLLHPPSILLEVPSTNTKCLSPIRELPTPLPSPALTPIMPRSRIASCASASAESGAGDEVSMELPDDDEEGSSRPGSSTSSIIKFRPSVLSSLSAETSSWSMSPASPAPPILMLQRASPGSPPPRPRRSLPALDGPPLITVTFGEPESDEPPSPAARQPNPNMCYLSPFSVVARADRAPSESNLSSSGYSSMASPGPSRCGSSNPLCPSEAEDPGGGGPRSTPPHWRRRPLSKTDSSASTGSTLDVENNTAPTRGRSDSETLSDEPPLESTDEGVDTERRLSDAAETVITIALPSVISQAPPINKTTVPEFQIDVDMGISCLKPPSIVIGNEQDRALSSASSRSESPLSEKSGITRFSSQFFGRNRDQLPFTDSDGLYDFPSSECVVSAEGASTQRKPSTQRRKKSPARVPTSPPSLLVVPGKESRQQVPRKIGQRKQRSRASRQVSSSSSSESVRSAQSARSVQSAKDLRTLHKSNQSLDTIAWQEWPHDNQQKSKSPLRPRKLRKRRAKTEEDISPKISSNIDLQDGSRRPYTKISRLRSISNQIRFLKRLEQSLKGKERQRAPSDEEGDESSSVTSPLLYGGMVVDADDEPRTRVLHKAVSLQEDLTIPLIHKTTSLPTNMTSTHQEIGRSNGRNRFQKPVRGFAVDEVGLNDVT